MKTKQLLLICSLIFLLISGFIIFKNTSYASRPALVNAVKNLSQTYNYTQGNGNGVYYTNNHEYRYIGSTVNNYVEFNDDIYRIIGVFDENTHGVSNTEMVKLIRARKLFSLSFGVYNSGPKTGTFSGYTNNWDGINLSTPSNNYVLLNDYYLNRKNTSNSYGDCSVWTYFGITRGIKTNSCNTLVGYGIKDVYRDYIADATWYRYGYNNNLSRKNMYDCERGQYSGCTSGNNGANNAETIAKIGLMYPSDYLYASGYKASSSTETFNNNFSRNNWLYSGSEWTITPNSSDNLKEYYIYNAGGIRGQNSYASYGIRPTFYLKPQVYVTGGDGTFDNPYTIACDNCTS